MKQCTGAVFQLRKANLPVPEYRAHQPTPRGSLHGLWPTDDVTVAHFVSFSHHATIKSQPPFRFAVLSLYTIIKSTAILLLRQVFTIYYNKCQPSFVFVELFLYAIIMLTVNLFCRVSTLY